MCIDSVNQSLTNVAGMLCYNVRHHDIANASNKQIFVICRQLCQRFTSGMSVFPRKWHNVLCFNAMHCSVGRQHNMLSKPWMKPILLHNGSIMQSLLCPFSSDDRHLEASIKFLTYEQALYFGWIWTYILAICQTVRVGPEYLKVLDIYRYFVITSCVCYIHLDGRNLVCLPNRQILRHSNQ